MRARRTLTVAAGCAAAVMLAAGAAHAHEHGIGWVHVDDDTVEVGAEGGQVADGAPDAGGGTTTTTSDVPVCVWELVPDDHIVNQRWAGDEDVTLYFVTCPNEPRRIVPVRGGDPDPASSPVSAWERALELLVIPGPQIEVNPSEPVVHIETWLWVDGSAWEARSETASAAGVTATVTATPRRVVWDMGNGDQVVCDGPGTPYDRSKPDNSQSTDCSYIYTSTSAGRAGDIYEVTAAIEWEITWEVVGGAGGGTLPLVTTSTTVALQVGEMQALKR